MRWQPRCSRTASWSTTPTSPGMKFAADLPAQENPGLHSRHQARPPAKFSMRRSSSWAAKKMALLEAHKAAGAEDVDDACMTLRTDGASIDIDGDYTETLARVDAQQERYRRFRPVVLSEQHRQDPRRHYGVALFLRSNPLRRVNIRFRRPLYFYGEECTPGRDPWSPGIHRVLRFGRDCPVPTARSLPMAWSPIRNSPRRRKW